MSATQRNKPGHERMTNDLYSTPSWCIRRLVEKFPELADLSMNRNSVWLEPAAGKGNLVQELNLALPQRPTWDLYDIDGQHEAALRNLGDTYICNFCHTKITRPCQYEVVITNPPYSIAMEFIEKAMEFKPKYTVMLLRTNFLASEDRSDFMSTYTPDLYVLPNRPCFVRGKSDNSEYAWFVWDRDKPKGTPGKVVMLDTTPLVERKLG